jgi:hypothetical protein
MLDAAMGAVIEDVVAARELLEDVRSVREEPSPRSLGTYSVETYSARVYVVRQRVKRAGFAELRNAFVRFGDQHTSEFLQLDKEIEAFAGQFRTHFNASIGFQVCTGVNAGVEVQLDRIEEQANKLRDWAAGGMKFRRDELAKDLTSPEPFLRRGRGR